MKGVKMSAEEVKIKTTYVQLGKLKLSEYNPRKLSEKTKADLIESIERFGMVDPIIVNSAPERAGVVIGGHQRLKVIREMGHKEAPVVYVNIPELEREKELNIRLNKNVGEFDYNLLSLFDEAFLAEVGFTSEELDSVFEIEPIPEEFDLEKELKKLNIGKVDAKKGDIYQLGNHRLIVGDSTIEEDMLKLMNGEKANLCLTDPPYILDYLKAKRHGEATTGFGAKKNRRYLETDVLPDDFTELWMSNVSKVADDNFSIIVFENWKNLKVIWEEIEKYWKLRNMIVWHLPNRVQGFAAKYKFFNKHDIAMVGSSEEKELNLSEEEGLFQSEYDTALFASSGKPHWESYEKGKKICPTDFIEFNAGDEKSTGQGIIFGTKPIEILIPYMKVLTKRGDLVLEPFCGSGSTMIAAEKMGRKCYLVEKSPVYATVAMNRWEKLTGKKAIKVN
jgi:DNA modification methylase